jgi:hypothetical protein
MGKRVVTLVTLDGHDADDILALSRCPVELKVRTMTGTPPEAIERLRERFGRSVQ